VLAGVGAALILATARGVAAYETIRAPATRTPRHPLSGPEEPFPSCMLAVSVLRVSHELPQGGAPAR
jgi:hypothetical protein